mmetsp:Transcript_40943/g.101419  ORF Transcript_40943/g.101419 Transcript_40943/m.101419 type:complete len:290 (+) Transcript_40943:657-1526(+)
MELVAGSIKVRTTFTLPAASGITSGCSTPGALGALSQKLGIQISSYDIESEACPTPEPAPATSSGTSTSTNGEPSTGQSAQVLPVTSEGMSTTMIAMIAGCVAMCCLLSLLSFFCWRRQLGEKKFLESPTKKAVGAPVGGIPPTSQTDTLTLAKAGFEKWSKSEGPSQPAASDPVVDIPPVSQTGTPAKAAFERWSEKEGPWEPVDLDAASVLSLLGNPRRSRRSYASPAGLALDGVERGVHDSARDSTDSVSTTNRSQRSPRRSRGSTYTTASVPLWDGTSTKPAYTT